MPIRPPRICRGAGCSATTAAGYCEPCAAKRRSMVESTRPSARERGYTSTWQRAREGFLRKHPLCRACLDLGRTEPATDVDHITPHRGDKVRFWDRANWQALCHRCHSAKTARESRFGRAAPERPAAPEAPDPARGGTG
jgi:5-methylcytosine-specific restriction enzyme A